jgi:hypothetical protein
MMLELGRTLLVHIARVPFIAEAWHGVYAPVDENAKLGILVPARDPVARF